MNATPPSQIPSFFHFGLIVTGKGEERHLPKLFRSLAATGLCTFRVIARVGQRDPITSPQTTAKIVGKGKIVLDKDENKIGAPALRFLSSGDDRCVIMVDDLEYDRRDVALDVFARYRAALDVLLTPEQKSRASVHFLVYMLEAYYFADANAINAVLHLNLEDYAEDVEAIRNPKGKLKQVYPGFHEIEHGGQILACIDTEHVLSRPDACASLRTLFAWCVKILAQLPYCDADSLADKYRLTDGNLSETTRSQ
jgi:hypothetical protein